MRARTRERGEYELSAIISDPSIIHSRRVGVVRVD
jgi:hypothetical protein